MTEPVKAPRFKWERIDERKGEVRRKEGAPLWRFAEFTERARLGGMGWVIRTVRRWVLLEPPFTLLEDTRQNVFRDEEGAWPLEVLPDVPEEGKP